MRNHSRKLEEPDNSQERWLVSYADFITLMFAFFVILYATSERDVEKTKKFQNAIEKFLIKAGSFGETGAKVEQGEKNFSVIEPPIQTFRQAAPDDTKLLEAIQARIESKFSESERKKYLLDISQEEKGVRLILSGNVVFDAKTAKFSPSAMPFINHLGKILFDEKKHVLIEGHVPRGIASGFPSTWDFASARAVNLLRYLSRKYEFPTDTFAVESFGDTRPLSAKNTGAAGNDRIELLVYFNDADF